MNKSYTAQELADCTDSKILGDPNRVLFGVADLVTAKEADVSFLVDPSYYAKMLHSKAGLVVAFEGADPVPEKTFLISKNPSQAFQKIVELFFQKNKVSSGFEGIHSSAVVHPLATLGDNVTIGPHTTIDQGVSIGANTTIGAGCYIGAESTIGSDCFFHSNISIRESSQIGNRVIIQSGSVIGSCGYGYTTDKQGKHTKLSQLGIVVIEDDVEIGALVVIDRARFQETRIGSGTKIGNLCQIAHGVIIGKNCLLIGQVGIAGSTTIGNNVVLAGKVAVNGHIEIGDGVMVAACSGVSKSIKKSGKYAGVPVMPLSQYNKNAVLLRNIQELIDRVEALEEHLN